MMLNAKRQLEDSGRTLSLALFLSSHLPHGPGEKKWIQRLKDKTMMTWSTVLWLASPSIVAYCCQNS